MKFPLIRELATVDVVKIDVEKTLDEAIDLMHKFNHRNVIVADGKEFFIITASDLLGLKLKQYDFAAKLSSLILEKLPIINKEENILETIDFLEKSIEYICTINNDGSLYGIITHTDIISNIDPETLIENYRIGDLMNMNKQIQKVSKDVKTADVLINMAENHYDCVVIMEDKMPLGILTTKDIMDLMKNSSDFDVPVSEYMSSPVESLAEDSSIKEAINFMKEKHFKRIVVTNTKGHLAGLILQRELISLSYSKWAILMKQYSKELTEINNLLDKKNKKYEKMASTDQLTGLYNRYKFTELFVLEYNTMTQRDNNMALMMIDIDYFKKINDTYGHNVGDIVLVQVSNLLLKYLRNVDIIGRWGGEEFVVLLPTASLENAVTLAQKIRDGISKYEMEQSLRVTASFGITEIKSGDELEIAIKRADDALYEAKNSGRNCVKTKV